MWLLRFHLIETRDYNKIQRILVGAGYIQGRTPYMPLIKGVLLHVLQGKSWRQSAGYVGISHVVLYQFYQNRGKNTVFYEIIEYCIHRKIALFLTSEHYISQEMLDAKITLTESIQELQSMRIEGVRI